MKLLKKLALLSLSVLLAFGTLVGCTVSGKAGKDGLSAYELAVKNGFEGSEQEWLASLSGADGTAGKDGLSAYQLAQQNGFKGSLQDWLLSLKGEDGENGESGEDGIGIASMEVIGGYLIVIYTDGSVVNVGKLPQGTSTDGSSEQTPGSDLDSLPDTNMNREVIYLRSYVRNENRNSFDALRDGDVINNAVYDVNTTVEQRLNCIIMVDEETVSGFGDEMYEEMSSLAGIESYHLLSGATYKMTALAIDGLLVDLASQSYIDLNNNYYSQAYNDALRVGNRQYQVTGPMTLSWYRYQAVTIFNRNVFSEMEVEYPYQTVLDGDGKTGGWTLAKMMETANNLYRDLNGNQIYDIDDQYGYFLQVGVTSSHTEGYMSALGLRLLEKSSDGYYKSVNVDFDRWERAISDYMDLIYCAGSYASDAIYSETIRRKFATNEAGMVNLRLYHTEFNNMISLARNGEGYGILPLPKANDTQLRYQSYIADQVLSLAIPETVTGNKLTNSAIFLEAYASEAYNTLVPTYEGTVFRRCIVDAESLPMLEIIRKNLTVDPINVYGDTVFDIHTLALLDVYEESVSIESFLNDQIKSGKLDDTVALLNLVYRLMDAAQLEAGE